MKSSRSIGKKRCRRRSAGNLNALEIDSLIASETAWRTGTRCSRIPNTLACGMGTPRETAGRLTRRGWPVSFGHCIQNDRGWQDELCLPFIPTVSEPLSYRPVPAAVQRYEHYIGGRACAAGRRDVFPDRESLRRRGLGGDRAWRRRRRRPGRGRGPCGVSGVGAHQAVRARAPAAQARRSHRRARRARWPRSRSGTTAS